MKNLDKHRITPLKIFKIICKKSELSINLTKIEAGKRYINTIKLLLKKNNATSYIGLLSIFRKGSYIYIFDPMSSKSKFINSSQGIFFYQYRIRL